MSLTRFWNPTRFVILFLLIGSALPLLLWRIGDPPPETLLLTGATEITPSREQLLLWPFLNGKVAVDRDASDLPVDLVLLSSPLYDDVNDGNALLGADRIKSGALEGRTFLCDGYSLTERVHSLFRNRLETFLKVDNTGWVLSYGRDREGARLLFRNSAGEEVLLEGGVHFSGKPPYASYEGHRAPVYTWIPVYEPRGDARVISQITLGLTAEGEALLDRSGLPREIPLIIGTESPLINTQFFAVEIPSDNVRMVPYKTAGKAPFLSRIALFDSDSSSALYWRIYIPWLRKQILRSGENRPRPEPGEPVRFRAREGSFFLREGEEERPWYVKGVNLGPALPGTWFTEFPEDEHLYYLWFSQMKGMDLNTLRIYTLLPPPFYRAFREFNLNNASDPLYLIQEIWPEEHPKGNNYLGEEYNRSYEEEIELTVDALHGDRTVEPRTGRAWGEYTADVSPWLMAWLVGREMEPDEVLETNRLNRGHVYRGRYISAPRGPAVEAWLAASCDLAIARETDRYGSSRPAGIVSWPILDPRKHPVEWNDPELNGREPTNDRAVMDINRLTVEDDSFGGLFGAYHIYPNYPDFMNNQSSYASYEDGQGTFRYGGYLKEFMENHRAYPALVAEYGISTSAVTAHVSPDGYDHGGLSEEEQARGIIRMAEAIKREGYAGAVIFEWIDEWAKKTWTTEPYMIPYDRQALWRNVLDPEQNYGIMAMRGTSERNRTGYASGDGGLSLEVWGSESHLYLRLPRTASWEGAHSLLIGLDTYGRDRGIRTFPGTEGVRAATGMESLVEVDLEKGEARLLTAEDYLISLRRFRSTDRQDQQFLPEEILVNRAYRREDGTMAQALYADWSTLRAGPLDEADRSYLLDEGGLTLRIPWGMLHVSDPSGGTVLDDGDTFNYVPERDGIETSESESILIYSLLRGGENRILALFPDPERGEETPVFHWDNWDVPSWVQGEKKSVPLLREYFLTAE